MPEKGPPEKTAEKKPPTKVSDTSTSSTAAILTLKGPRGSIAVQVDLKEVVTEALSVHYQRYRNRLGLTSTIDEVLMELKGSDIIVPQLTFEAQGIKAKDTLTMSDPSET